MKDKKNKKENKVKHVIIEKTDYIGLIVIYFLISLVFFSASFVVSFVMFSFLHYMIGLDYFLSLIYSGFGFILTTMYLAIKSGLSDVKNDFVKKEVIHVIKGDDYEYL